MNLLIINYEMDPDSQVLSWQVKVAFALANFFDNVVVLTHKQKKIAQIPANVKIIEFPLLAKAPLRWFGGEYLLNFWVWQLHRQYQFDSCFMHMNYRWAYRFAPFFKLSGIPVNIWYAHGTVNKWLRLAHYFADKIISSNKYGFRISSTKTVFIGQAIDTELFKPNSDRKHSSNIIFVGRISRKKRIELLIDTLHELNANKPDNPFTLTIIGAPLNQNDHEYYEYIYQYITQKSLIDNVFFTGAVKHSDIPQYYNDSFVHLSFSGTGSMDKSLLESLSAGCPILTSNEALFDMIEKKYHIEDDDLKKTAEQVSIIYIEQGVVNRLMLRDCVAGNHDFCEFISRLKKEF